MSKIDCKSKLEIIEKTVSYVKDSLYFESSGHDWWHVYRVWKTARDISEEYEHIDSTVVELSALLHDLADWKENKDDLGAGCRIAREWLSRFDQISDEQIEHVCGIIGNISFKGDTERNKELSMEGQIVQDADRLDATGAMGIARTFAYGGKKGQIMYDPEIPPQSYKNQNDYISNHDNNTAVNHFYEKLLNLKDLMNTEEGRLRAVQRHDFMLSFLEQFYREFEGKVLD